MSKCLRIELKAWNIHVCNINPGPMKTPMALNSGSLSKKLFEAAPIAIQNQYSNAKEQIDKLEKSIHEEDPKVVVMAMKRLVTAANPSLVNLTGIFAKLVGFLLIFPAFIGDWISSLVSVVIVPLPEVLASVQKPRTID